MSYYVQKSTLFLSENLHCLSKYNTPCVRTVGQGLQVASLPEKPTRGSWIQTQRAAHEHWAQFLALRGATAASRVMHLLLARMGDHNAVVVSQKTLAALLQCDERTVRRAISMLRLHNWIDVRQIGDRGTVNAYVINDRLAWYGAREGARYSLFSATVIVSEAEQPDQNTIDDRKPLHRLPRLFPGEQQLPSGDGLLPPSEPSLPGMEPDLPALHEAAEREPIDEAVSLGTLVSSIAGKLSESN